MNLFDYLDSAKLSEQIAQGMVKRTDHPDLPLCILNYTPKAQFTPELWNDTTDKCRGLIYHAHSLEIVARPFVKFWNYNDQRHPETLPENLPAAVPIVTRKFDGSLGILYRYDGKWAVATRGSFTSAQALWATAWFNGSRDFFTWPLGWTPLVEIIFPENQIVVKYDWSGLVLLGAVNVETGEEKPWRELAAWARANDMRVVDRFDKPLSQCAAEDVDNEEGYVVSWDRPGTWPLRVKVKMETYCKLHRLLTGTNPVTIWEILRDGSGLEGLTADAPADFAEWANGVAGSLRSSYEAAENAALAAMAEYTGEKSVSTPEQRKQFALYATSKQPMTPILFAMLDGKDYSPIIWKMVRPKASDTFKVDIDL